MPGMKCNGRGCPIGKGVPHQGCQWQCLQILKKPEFLLKIEDEIANIFDEFAMESEQNQDQDDFEHEQAVEEILDNYKAAVAPEDEEEYFDEEEEEDNKAAVPAPPVLKSMAAVEAAQAPAAVNIVADAARPPSPLSPPCIFRMKGAANLCQCHELDEAEL